jgi:hypothetical protein
MILTTGTGHYKHLEFSVHHESVLIAKKDPGGPKQVA